jgi:hypothetical protein
MRRSANTGVLFVLLTLAVGGTGCHSDCAEIAPGTPASNLPLVSRAGFGLADCSPSIGSSDELQTLRCCYLAQGRADAGADPSECAHGAFDCSNVRPAVPWNVGDGYSGWECGEYAPVHFVCIAWVRDQQVVGTCSGCPPD